MKGKNPPLKRQASTDLTVNKLDIQLILLFTTINYTPNKQAMKFIQAPLGRFTVRLVSRLNIVKTLCNSGTGIVLILAVLMPQVFAQVSEDSKITYSNDGFTDSVGACYFADTDYCEVMSADSCRYNGGQFAGINTDCDKRSDEGACCENGDPSYNSCRMKTEEECLSSGGTYYGDGVSCSDVQCNGACCTNAGCHYTSEDGCQGEFETFYGIGSYCSDVDCVLGACCLYQGFCETCLSSYCNSIGGTFTPGVTCDDFECYVDSGACCYGNNICEYVPWYDCNFPGVFILNADCSNDTCVSVEGACCDTVSGYCLSFVTEPSCELGEDQVYMGDGTTCAEVDCGAPSGACCYPDGNCVVQYESSCINTGGIYQGDGVSCSPGLCSVSDDLEIIEMMPIQVVENINTFVVGKPTVVKITVKNSFSATKNVDFQLWAGSDLLYTEDNVEFQPGVTCYYFPGGPTSNVTAWGNDDDVFYLESMHDQTTFTMVLDYNDKIAETLEGNNSIPYGPVTVIESDNHLSILYKRIRLSLLCGSDQGVSLNTFNTTASNSSYFINSTYPIPFLYWGKDYYEKYSSDLCIHYDKKIARHIDLAELAETLILERKNYSRIVGIASNEYFNVIIPEANGFHISDNNDINRATIILEDYYTVAAHEIHHSYDKWRTGKPDGLGGKEEYDQPPNYIGFDATGIWISERDVINQSYDANGPGICFMGGKSLIPGDFKYHMPSSQWRDFWVCDQCYSHLINTFSASKRKTTLNFPAMLISGYIDKQDNVVLDPVYILDSAHLNTSYTGDYFIKLLDSGGALIQENSFGVSFTMNVEPEGLIDVDTASFVIAIPYDESAKAATASIQIAKNDLVLDEYIISANSPAVSVSYPNGGEILGANEECSLNWQGTDVDGDSISYSILFSSDAGLTWNVLALNVNDTTFTWSIPSNTNSTECLIKVLASDGVNTSTDLSDSLFSVEQFYICGDANYDFAVDISDAVYIINYAFGGGTAPEPLQSGDANCDSGVDVSDAVYIINYAFAGGSVPCDLDDDTIPDC